MSAIDNMIEEYKLKITMLENIKKKFSEPEKKSWNSVEEMMRDISKLPKKTPAKKLTIEEIDSELDVIRGIKPTPVGYTVKPERMKDLMSQRKELIKQRN